MFPLLLARSFTRGLRHKTLAIATIALGASLAAAMLNLSLDVGDKIARELRSYGANLLVLPQAENLPSEIAGPNTNPLAGQSFLRERDLAKIKTIFWRHNILSFAPFLEGSAVVKGRRVPVVGTWFNKQLTIETGEKFRVGMKKTKPWIRVNGAWAADADARAAMVGAGLAKQLRLRPGDRLHAQLEGEPLDLVVSGILIAGGTEDRTLFLPLGVAQKFLGLPGKVSKAEVGALTTPENELARKYQKDPNSLSSKEWEKWYCTAYIDSIAYQIEEAIPGSQAKPIRQVAQSEGVILSKVQLLMFLLTMAALASSSLGISSLMATVVLERNKEIGLAKALGAENWAVILLFLSEAALMGLFGGGLGYGLGMGLAGLVSRAVFGTAASLKGLVAPVTVAISLLIALGGSLTAVRTIGRLSPKEVLHGS